MRNAIVQKGKKLQQRKFKMSRSLYKNNKTCEKLTQKCQDGKKCEHQLYKKNERLYKNKIKMPKPLYKTLKRKNTKTCKRENAKNNIK